MENKEIPISAQSVAAIKKMQASLNNYMMGLADGRGIPDGYCFDFQRYVWKPLETKKDTESDKH